MLLLLPLSFYCLPQDTSQQMIGRNGAVPTEMGDGRKLAYVMIFQKVNCRSIGRSRLALVIRDRRLQMVASM